MFTHSTHVVFRAEDLVILIVRIRITKEFFIELHGFDSSSE